MKNITPKLKKYIEKSVLAVGTEYSKQPHVIAVSCVNVLSKNKVIITDNFMSKTTRNIKKNNKISLCLWGNQGGYEITGTADYYNKGKWAEFVKSMKENRGLPAKGAIIVNIKNISKLA